MSKLVNKHSVIKTLLSMAVPMLGGTIAMNAFNLADTFFVARLGTIPLAAMGFTFPIVMLLITLVRGVGTAGTTLVSHATGSANLEEARKITTHTLILAIIMVILFTTVGILTIEPVFKLLGATSETMPLIREYMTVWYLGQIFLVIPMMSNDIIRGIGDFISPSVLMIFSCVLNIILDPIMIFGYFGCPAMGITGAALATLISRAAACILVVYVLVAKHKMISLKALNLKAIIISWKKIFLIAVPITLGTILMPVSGGIITRMVASFGVDAVAAVSAGSRIEMFAFMIPMALGMSLIPFIGQNFGAGRMDRVHEGKKISYIFAIVIGIFVAITFALSSSWFAELFTKSDSVALILKQYLLIIPIGYGMMEVHRYAGFFMTGINRPVHASINNVIRIVILVGFSIVGTIMGSIIWLFVARVIADISSGTIGICYSNIILKKTEDKCKLFSN